MIVNIVIDFCKLVLEWILKIGAHSMNCNNISSVVVKITSNSGIALFV